MTYILPAIRCYLIVAILCGLIYPFMITGVGQVFFAKQANGSLVLTINKTVIGSELLAQKFEQAKYFWPRPSAIDFNPLPSGGSNLAWISTDLMKVVKQRQAKLGKQTPALLLFASGSGLDPHLDLDSALYQIPRIAIERKIPEEKIREIVFKNLEPPSLGFLGEAHVNVLSMNLQLDEQK